VECEKIVLHQLMCNTILGEMLKESLLFLLLVVHEACTVAASLCDLHTVLVTELVGLLHELLHLLHDHLVLLLILLLVGHGLLRLLVARRVVRHLLLLWLLRCLIPRIGDVVSAGGLPAAALLLGLTCRLF